MRHEWAAWRATWRNKISLAIRLQSHRELVEMLRDLVVVVEVLDEVYFTIAVQIPQPSDLVAACHIDGFLHNFQAEGLKQAGGDPLPDQLSEVAINAAHPPHVSVPGADRRAPAVLEKIEAAEAHPAGFPAGGRKLVHGERTVFVPSLPRVASGGFNTDPPS
jgi:hypothetical protein